MPVLSFHDKHPIIGDEVFYAPDSWIIGDVNVSNHVSIFFGSVLRGDILPIEIGEHTNIQEHSLLHTSTGLTPCIVGKSVTVGHRAILHGCKIADHCIIGMGSTILDGAEVGEFSIVGANSLITMNSKIPPRSLAFGSPAKAIRSLSQTEVESIKESAEHYRKLGAYYRQALTGFSFQ